MIGVAEARAGAAATLRRRGTDWAVAPPDEPALTILLKPPTEREAMVDQAGAEAWARAWTDPAFVGGLTVEWEERSWRRVGRQRVPVRLVARRPDDVAALAGGRVASEWRLFAARVAEIRGRWGPSEELDATCRRHAREITGWDEDRFLQVLDVAQWLAIHPSAGLRPRQVPVRGVDSKWLGRHRGVLTALTTATTGRPGLGLVDGDPLLRVRCLDSSLCIGGLADLAAPVRQLASLALRPDVVFVFENLETVLAMPQWPGAVVLHGSGYAVDVLEKLPWLARCPIVYWGDLDSHGFAILNRLRSHLDGVTSVLMDEKTLLDHRDLWVIEPRPARGVLDELTSDERAVLARIRAEGDVRLEQERIPWDLALRELRSVSRG